MTDNLWRFELVLSWKDFKLKIRMEPKPIADHDVKSSGSIKDWEIIVIRHA